MPYAPGKMIGRYRVIETIGEGGFGEVYRATDTDLGRTVAIKVPKKGHKDSWNKIVTEARTLAMLEHQSVVKVLDINNKYNYMNVIMENLARNFVDELSAGRIPFRRTVELMIALADALDYVHRRGLLHRNVKPRVILLDNLGQPRLGGFELAIEREKLILEEPGVSISGTPCYMSPEHVLREPSKAGPPMDIWGFGVSLYEMLTGKLPFQGEDLGAIINQIVNKEPLPPRAVDSTIPEELEEICLQCLEKVPAKRYSSMERVAGDLGGWLRGQHRTAKERVFVSHATKDRDFVEREIVSLLEGRGIRTWYSKVDIQTAAQWERSIMDGLESSGWFLLVMSPRAAASEWVKDEVHWAIDKRPGRIIPVLIEECDLRAFHIRMARLQHVDFRNDVEAARKNLLNLIHSD